MSTKRKTPAKPAASPPKRPRGRPSKFTPQLAAEICDRLMDGKSLVEICEAADMPKRRIVLKWMSEDENFCTRIARAREEQGEVMDHKIMQEALTATPETAALAKVRIDAYKWRASKLAPKKYGDKLDVDAKVDAKMIIEVVKNW